jgi:precorrin-3B synthase
MQSGDGLLVRLRIIGGAVTPDLARALAQCAKDFGNGLVDLSSRGNLQLRGVTQDALPVLQRRLDAFGLLDAEAEAEAVRNVLISPLAGIDPSALIDSRPLAYALDEMLRSDRNLHHLPGKFLFTIEDGGHLPLPWETADVAFIATEGAAAPYFAIYLGGIPAGACDVKAVCATAARLSSAFLELRRAEDRRMRDLVQRDGSKALAQAAELDAMPETAPHATRCTSHSLGLHLLGAQQALGLGIPFGRLDAKALQGLADAADAVTGKLRLSPWRAIFLIAHQIPSSIADRLRDMGFILDDQAPIRAVAACAGKLACLHGETKSQADALLLAPVARALGESGIALHVSACTKGCAHPGKAPVTLIGHDGAYDLVIDGRAGDPPILRGLTVADVEKLLPRLAAIAPADRAAFIRNHLCEAAR